MHDRRALIEAQLTDAELGVLASLCASIPAPVGLWTELPVTRAFVVLAAERLAARIRDERGCTLTLARRLAASCLGERADSIERLRRLWRSRAYRNVVPGHASAACVD